MKYWLEQPVTTAPSNVVYNGSFTVKQNWFIDLCKKLLTENRHTGQLESGLIQIGSTKLKKVYKKFSPSLQPLPQKRNGYLTVALLEVSSTSKLV